MSSNITVVEPGKPPVEIEILPDTTSSGFIYWRGDRREIREIHETKNGKQIELYEQ